MPQRNRTTPRAITPRSGPGILPGNRDPRRGAVALHPCPVRHCTGQLGPSVFICHDQWQMVPKPLRDEVWATWDRGRGKDSDEFRAAVRAAAESVVLSAPGEAPDGAA